MVWGIGNGQLVDKWIRLETIKNYLDYRDKTTQFFPQMANSNLRSNFIQKLVVGEIEIANNQNLSQPMVEFYAELNSKTEFWRPKLDGRDLCLGADDSDLLELPFTEKKICDALHSCNGENALGLEVLLWILFFIWSTVQGEIVEQLRNLLSLID